MKNSDWRQDYEWERYELVLLIMRIIKWIFYLLCFYYVVFVLLK